MNVCNSDWTSVRASNSIRLQRDLTGNFTWNILGKRYRVCGFKCGHYVMLCLPLQGLGYLHIKGKMHRDIKVQLVFISFSLNVNFLSLLWLF